MNSNILFNITKLKLDENNSYSYFRSFITFYNYIFFVKKLKDKEEIKNSFLKYYKNLKYYDLFFKEFLINKNPLIFTFYNNIPIHFFPYIKDLYYYYPYITFYNNYQNNRLNYYKKGNIKFNEKNYYKFIPVETFKYNINEIQVTMPIIYFKNIKILKDNYVLLKINKNFIITKDIKFINDKIFIKNYNLKNKNNYIFIKKENSFNFSDINFAQILLKITKKSIENIFKIDIINKDAILYDVSSKKRDNLEHIWYLFMYPKIDPFKYEDNHVTYCRRIKVKKKIPVVNLNLDIFYNNDIVNRENINYNYIDNIDENYNNLVNRDIFRCINNGNILKDNSDICNLTKRNFNYLTNYSWFEFKINGKKKKNLGKEFLNLLIFKNKYLTEYNKIYFVDWLANYNIYTFTYNYGYFFYDNKKMFYDTEMYFNSELLNIDEYFILIDRKEGRCSNLYKTGKLINEKLIV